MLFGSLSSSLDAARAGDRRGWLGLGLGLVVLAGALTLVFTR